MTISTTTNQVTYAGDGTSLAFAFPSPFIAMTDLKVYLNGLIQTTGYSVAGIAPTGGSGTFASGTVTFTAAPAAGVVVLIYCDPDLLQSMSLPPNDPFPSKTVEKAFDKLTLIVQRLFNKVTRAILVPDGESGTTLTLPAASVRAGNLLSFDSIGNVNVSAPVAGSATALASDLASSILATKNSGQIGFLYSLAYAAGTIGRWLQDLATSAGSGFIGWMQAGTGAILRTLQSKLRENVSVLDFAANGVSGVPVDPTGVVDSTGGILAALAASKYVTMPAGSYKVSAPIAVGADQRLSGVGKGIAKLKPTGTYLACLQAIGPNYASWLEGVVIEGIEVDGSNGFTGVGLYSKYVGLRSRFSDLYIHSLTGKGVYTEGNFDHNYERIEVRACTGLGIHNYEKQAGPDGVYEEASKLIFTDCWSLENNSSGVQWQVDGGDTYSFNECKPSEGTVGIDFTRNCFGHRIRNLMFDQIPFAGAGNGIAIRTNAQFVQALYIDGVQSFQAQYDLQVLRGQNIHIEHANTVRVEATADGNVFVGENIAFTDARATPHTYPRNSQGTWGVAFNGGGSVLGNGTLTGKYTINGNVCTANILLTLGSTTVVGSNTGFNLPFAAVELHAGSAVGIHGGNIWQLAIYAGGTTVLVGTAGSYMSATVPFTWVTTDQLAITVTYRLP